MSPSRTSSTAWGQAVETGTAPQGVSWTESTSGKGHEPIFAERPGPMPSWRAALNKRRRWRPR